MGQHITANRHKGYISHDELFYEDEEYRSGSSRIHSDETIEEFANLINMSVEMDNLVTRQQIPDTIPIQPVSFSSYAGILYIQNATCLDREY